MNRGKILSWVIVFALILGTFAATPLTASAQVTTSGDWITDGSPTIWTTGSGLVSDPYQIGSVEQLAYLAQQLSIGTEDYTDTYFLLASNIDLEAHYWVPIGNGDNPFDGHFDGGGKVINFLRISDINTDCQGLFGSVSASASLTNITLRNVEVIGRDSVGGVAGESEGSISNCSVQGSISGGFYVGGLVGNLRGDVERCMADAEVTGSADFAGGLIGRAEGIMVEQSYSLGVVTGSATVVGGLIGKVGDSGSHVVDSYSRARVYSLMDDANKSLGGLIGFLDQGTVTNCYSTGLVTNDDNDLSGGLIGVLSTGAAIEDCYYDSDTSGQIDTDKGNSKTTEEMKTLTTFPNWDFPDIWTLNESDNDGYPALAWQGYLHEGEITDCIIPGCSTPITAGGISRSMLLEDEPGDDKEYYCVENRLNLEHISMHMDSQFVQTQDIDLGKDPWTPIGGFSEWANFYGKLIVVNNSIIDNMTFKHEDGSAFHAGLFGILSEDAHVDGINLMIDDIDLRHIVTDGAIDTGIYFGGIAGRHESPRTIINCTVTLGSIQVVNEIGDVYFGGIAGYNYGNLEGCRVYNVSEKPVTISSPSNSYVGGIVGYTYGYLFGCDHEGSIVLRPLEQTNVQNIYLGGIAGYADSRSYWDYAAIDYCQNNGDIMNMLVGDDDPETKDGLIEGAYVGGIVGYLYSEVYNTFDAADLEDNEYAGSVVRNCANIGEINKVSAEAASAMAGGIVGASRFIPEVCPYILNCYNRSEVLSTRTTPAAIEQVKKKAAGQNCEGAASGGIIGATGGIIIGTSYSSTPTIAAVQLYQKPLVGIAPVEDEQAYAGGIAGLVWDSQFLQNYYEKNETVKIGIGAEVDASDSLAVSGELSVAEFPGYTIIPVVDTEDFLGVAANQLKDKAFFSGSEWLWNPGKGEPPHYYYYNEEEESVLYQWRYTAANSYPVLRGAMYTTPVTPPNGGGGGGSRTAVTTTPAALNKVDHFAYVLGYPDGEVKPLGTITKEEVAVIFYRLMTEESRKAYSSTVQPFTDISSDRWSSDEIATLYNAKIIQGSSDGKFMPAKPITRAEFAAIAAKFDKLEKTQENKFSDIGSHWAKDYINSSAEKGWISGYEDGTFRPDNSIIRCEAMKLINEVLDRRVDVAGLHKESRQWPDNTQDKWYYEIVLEATNTHDYERADKPKSIEKWTKIKNDPVW